MEMILTVLAILLVIAALAWFLFVRQPGPSRSKRRPAPVTSAPHRPGGIDKLAESGLYWGVELADTGCEAARNLQGRQYSFETAPELPLPDCSSATCTCRFSGLRERRSQLRRTNSDRREEVRFDVDNPDRRARVSRRRADKWSDHTY